jgi:hypothetical protein
VRGHLFGRGWRLATPHTVASRYHHSDRLPGHHLPEASHVARSLR